ncbi:MAG: ATP-binding protein, partial [bacterium]|nr:ATP-binding protein [bacterium]
MTLFKRKIEQDIRSRLFKGRAILLFGPRQAGKTTLSKKILKDYGERGEYYNCELVSVRQAFVPGKPELIKELVREKTIVVFDEAQTIQDIGIILKTFIDTYPEVQIIATGSSSFDLANKINEPLTGRAFEFTLFPLSLEEIRMAFTDISMAQLREYLRLGTYPAIVGEKDRAIREDLLKNLTTNYLYKDIYTFESIRNPRVFEDLVRLLALQVGSLVSVNELSQTLGVSRLTVGKYIRLLEQSYVIKVVRSFSRNSRTEIKKAFKVFFYDNGIRNAVIDKFSDVGGRDDRGALFENFFVAERLKLASLRDAHARVMFWRNRQGEEIDVVEETEDKITAFECKWNNNIAKVRKPAQFAKSYPDASFHVIT